MEKHRANGLVYYTSKLLDSLDIKHGFFTRMGGVSKSPYANLNVKKTDDEIAAVIENRKRMCDVLGLDVKKLVFANELGHSDRALLVGSKEAGMDVPGLDALITKAINTPIALSVADCVPVLLASKNKEEIAVIHVSWRSLNTGIIKRTFELTRIQPTQFIAALGPCIAVESYEVQDNFVQQLKPHLKKFLKEIDNRLHFDLQAASVNEIKKFGVTEIEVADIDTYTNTGEFYSYRKEGLTGRFGAIVSL